MTTDIFFQNRLIQTSQTGDQRYSDASPFSIHRLKVELQGGKFYGDVAQTEIRISAYDLRDRFTATRTLLGSASIQIQDLKEQGKFIEIHM
jgi:hypothetical protein